MGKGKKPMDPILDEEERRFLKALCDFEIIIKQFSALMQKMNEWLEKHRAPNEQHPEETQTAPDGEDSASALLASAEELSDTIGRFLRELDGDSEASTGGSGLTADQNPEVPLAEQKPEAPPADPKPEPSTP